jgi:hypothetical protein
MKRWPLLILAVLLCSAALGRGVGQLLRARQEEAEERELPPHWTTGAPPLRLRVETWDIGTTAPGQEMRRRIGITNATGHSWTLRHLSATCSCATASLSAKVVPPGGATWLEITYRAPQREGPVSGNVMVEFAEPGSAIVQVNLSAMVAGGEKGGRP